MLFHFPLHTMKTFLISRIVAKYRQTALLVVLSVCSLSTVFAQTIHVPDDYPTIQAAIDAANNDDIIEVAAGTYVENVNISSKDGLTLRGAQAGVSAGVGAARNQNTVAGETILNGTITSGSGTSGWPDGLTIDGFRLENTNFVQSIRIKGDVVITNCIVHHTSQYFLISVGGNAGMEHKLSLSNSNINGQRGFSFGNARIEEGTIHNNVFNSTAASLISASALDGIANITGNEFNGPRGLNLLTNNNIIADNVFDVTAGGSSRGMDLYEVTNNTITGNVFSPDATSILVINGGRNEAVLDNMIQNNALLGGVSNLTSKSVDATCNWWGQISGPTSAQTFGNVNASTWLINDDLADPNCAGGQPVIVKDGTTLDIKSGHTAIQEGIDAAAPGDVIEVSPGTYEETIDINVEGLTIVSTDGAAETIIKGVGPSNSPSGATVRITANDVTLDGFTVDNEGGDRGCVSGGNNAENTTLQNNTFTNSARGVRGDFYGRFGAGLLIHNNTFDGVERGITNTEDIPSITVTDNTFEDIGANGVSFGSGVNTVTITGNTFSNTGQRHILNYEPTNNFVLLDVLNENTFDLAAASDDVASLDVEGIYSSIGQAVAEAGPEATITVLAGTYDENVNINKPLTLLGANAGTACSDTRDDESVLNAGPAGTAITIESDGVTIDGFTIQGAVGIVSENNSELQVLNNIVEAEYLGIALTGITTSTASSSLSQNCVEIGERLNPATEPTSGIVVGGVFGSEAMILANNSVSGDPFYGMLYFGINTVATTTVSGGSVSGATVGLGVVNTIDGATFFPSTLAIDGFTANGFDGLPDVFQAGIYAFTGGASAATDVLTLNITNVSLDGVNSTANNSAGISLSDFSTQEDETLIVATITESTLTNNNPRGLHATGSVEATVSNSVFTGNGADGTGYALFSSEATTAGTNGAAHVTVENCFITHPATSPGGVTAFVTNHNGTMTANNNRIDFNGNASANGASTTVGGGNGGPIDATCNWWGTDDGTVIAAAISGDVSFELYLTDGGDSGSAAPGFSPTGDCDGCVSGNSVQNVNKGTFYCSIQAAIDDADPDDLIQVSEGYFEEDLASWKDMEITKSLTLIGAGSGLTFVGLTEDKTNGVEIRGVDLDVHIEGITFTKRNGSDYASNFALRVAETTSSFLNFSLKDVVVECAKAPNVHLGSNGTFENVEIEDCHIRYAGTYGFFAQGEISSMTVTNSNFTNNGLVDSNLGKGLEFANGPFTDVTVDGGDFSNNLRNGINLNNISNSTFRNLTASNNGTTNIGHGINFVQYSGGSSSGVLFENITANTNAQDGIQLGSESGQSISDITVEGGEFHGNPRAGIFRWGGFGGTTSSITIDGATISGNQPINLVGQSGNLLSGIKVHNVTATDISGGGNTIVVEHANDVEYIGNDVSGSDYNALVVLNSTDVLIEDNEAYDNIYAGIILVDVSGAEIVGNTVHDNSTGTDFEFGGITIFGSCSNVEIENNLLLDNVIGVKVFAASTGIAVNNNSITGGTWGVKNDAAFVMDATCNWWGNACPSSAVSGDVNVYSYLTDGTDDDPAAPGFQPLSGVCDGAELSTLTICDDDISVNTEPGFCTKELELLDGVMNNLPGDLVISFEINDVEITSADFTFPLGATIVDVTASNACGTVTCEFMVTVADNEDPVVDCASSITVLVNDLSGGYLVNGSELDPLVSDNCTDTEDIVVSHNAASLSGMTVGANNASLEGWIFPVGTTTTVEFTAADASANTETCTVSVTVEELQLSGTAVINMNCNDGAPVRIRVFDGTGQVGADFTGNLDATGNFGPIALEGVPAGTYTVNAKIERYLSKGFTGVDMTSASVQLANLTQVIPGDVAGNGGNFNDDAIDGVDLSLLVEFYNTDLTVGTPPAGAVRCNLNCDDFVDAIDLSFMTFFFLSVGAQP